MAETMAKTMAETMARTTAKAKTTLEKHDWPIWLANGLFTSESDSQSSGKGAMMSGIFLMSKFLIFLNFLWKNLNLLEKTRSSASYSQPE